MSDKSRLMFREPSEAVKRAWENVERACTDFENEMGGSNLEDVAVFAGEVAAAAKRLEDLCDQEFAEEPVR